LKAFRFISRFPVRITAFLVVGSFLFPLLAPPSSIAAEHWKDNKGRVVPATLEKFDFEGKTLICTHEDGRELHIPSNSLSLVSKLQLFFSPKFFRSFPEDRWTAGQGLYFFILIGVPAYFMLISFYLCGCVICRKFNPAYAFGGWFGSVLLGGFLAGFYFIFSERNPGSAMVIFIIGSVVISVLLSVFISIVFKTTTMNGFLLLVTHFAGAFLLLFLTVLVIGNIFEPVEVESFLDRRIFTFTGLLPPP
jgi:hypothetical protein